MRIRKLNSTQGFTIIELMVALSVLAVILVMSTVVLIQIGKLYSKGVNQATLQNATRNVTADISSTFQFGGRNLAPCTDNDHGTTCYTGILKDRPLSDGTKVNIYSFCIGTIRYSYVLGHMLDKSALQHVLWRDTMESTSSCPPLDIRQSPPTGDNKAPDDNGYEMAPDDTRLTRFKVKESGDLYNIDVWMAYGASDLLDIQPDGYTSCKSTIGMQFCAVSELSTSVASRIN